jgi:hypothetical protein
VSFLCSEGCVHNKETWIKETVGYEGKNRHFVVNIVKCIYISRKNDLS